MRGSRVVGSWGGCRDGMGQRMWCEVECLMSWRWGGVGWGGLGMDGMEMAKDASGNVGCRTIHRTRT